jgi:glycosyltransferase involved in cell wall biosynthesis
MKVSVLTPDLSHNCLGRAFVLAELLDRNFEIEIVGPTLGDGVWSPLEGEYEYKKVDMNKYIYNIPLKYGKISEKISGDIIYASKPRTTSYGYGLINAASKDRPLILDIDDWESGFIYDQTGSHYMAYLKTSPTLASVDGLIYMRLLEAAAPFADGITVSNNFLQNKFGGEIIPHVRDVDKFDPGRYDTESIRNEFNLPKNRDLILFSGTPRRHKGVDDLIRAVETVDADVSLLIVGAEDSKYVAELKSLSGNKVIFRGQQPFDTLPKWIAIADIVAIPQKDTPSTRGQLPAKLFDAMAMGKPIISTAVSDIPEILDGCGLVVAPGSYKEIAEAITELLADRHKMAQIGGNARKKCHKKYSYDATAPKIAELVREVRKGYQ